jgi:hypothetical protein
MLEMHSSLTKRTVYHPREPEGSPLWRLLNNHYDSFGLSLSLGQIDPENLPGGSPYLHQMRGEDEDFILHRKPGNN